MTPPAETSAEAAEATRPPHKGMSWVVKLVIATLVLCLIALPTALFIWLSTGASGGIGALAHFMNGKQVGRFGQLQLEGVTETRTGAKIAQLSLSDTKGPWLVIKGLDFDWTSSALLARRLELRRVVANQTGILRQPILGPPGRARPSPIDIQIDTFATNLRVAAGVVRGVPALSHQTSGQLALNRDHSVGIKLLSKAISGPADTLKVDMSSSPKGPLRLLLDAEGGSDGLITAVFGAPNAVQTRLSIVANGDVKAGQAKANLVSDAQIGAALVANWTVEGGQLNGFIAPHPQSWLGLQLARVGNRLDIQAKANKLTAQHRTLAFLLSSPALTGRFDGPVDFQRLNARTGSTLKVERADLTLLSAQKVAGLVTGEFAVEGELRPAIGSLKGQMTAIGLRGFGLSLNRVTSPVEISATASRLKISADLIGQMAAATDPRLATLGSNPRLALNLEQDRDRAIWTLSKAELTGKGMRANLTGRLSRDVRQIQGRANFADVAALIPNLTGQAQLDVNLSQTTNAPWQGNAIVKGQRLASSNQVISKLVGNQLHAEFVPSATSANNAFTWQVETGAALARGTLDLSNNVPLRGVWSLKAPLVISGVSIAGGNRGGAAGDLAFGPAGFAIGSRGSRIAIGGWNLENANILAVGGTNGKPINAALDGIAPLGPASISTSIVARDGVANLTNIVARHAGLQAMGTGRSVGRTFDSLFDLKIEPGAVLVSGATAGKLGIAVRNGQVGVAADLAMTQAVFANVPAQISKGRFRAQGLLGALTLVFDGDVRAGTQQGQLALNGLADLDGRDTSLVLNGSGNIGGQRFVLSQPLRAVPLGTKARVTAQALWGDYRLGVDGQIRDGGVDVKFVDLAGPTLTARLAGRVGGSASNLRGTARVANLSAINARLRGSAQGDLTVTGRGAQGWSARIQGEANNLSVGSTDADALLGARPRFEFAANALAGRDITGAWKLTGKQLSGEGNVTPPRAGGLSDVSGVWRIDGPVKLGGLDVAGQIAGDILLRNGALAVNARSPNLSFAGQSWSDLSASTTIANILTPGDIPVVAEARGGLGPLKLNTTFVSGPTPSLRPLVISYGGIEGRGSLLLASGGPAGTLQLQGNLGAFLTSGSASGAVTLSQSSQGPQIDARLGLSNVSYAAGGITGLNGPLAANGPLNNLAASIDTRFNVRGQSAAARLTGQFSQRDGDSRLLVNGGGTYQGAPWRLAEPLSVNSQNKTTRASARAVWREADISFDATLDPSRLRLVANLKDAPASLFNQGATRLDGRLSGTLTMNAQTGTGQGGNFNGDGQLQAVGLRPVTAERREAIDGAITATLRNGALVIQGDATNPRGLRATADARLSVITGLSPFRLEVARTSAITGNFEIGGPVEAVAKLALSRNSTASGTILARGQLSGTVASPSIQGRAELNNAALRDPSLGVRVTDANAVVNFLGPIADIETLTASDGRGGKLQLGGRIALGQGANWRLAGQLDKFQLIDSSEALIVATGPWSLAANNGQTTLGGELILNSARVGIPAGTNRGDVLRVREINRPSSLPALPAATPDGGTNRPAARPSGSNDLRLDLKITAPGTARVVSRGFDGYFDLGVGVTGSLRAPQVSGRADLVRGRFDLAGRSFDMTKGSVRFLAPLEASRIEFIASRETADITALAKIQGTLGRPVFRLESTPPAPQDEILARILFGRNVAALSLPQAAQLALGVSSLATGNQLDPTARLGQALGLERFSLGTEGGGFSGFTAGLRLVRDVYVEVTTGGEDGTVTMLEWRPRPRIQVQVTTSQKRESAVSVRLRSKD